MDSRLTHRSQILPLSMPPAFKALRNFLNTFYFLVQLHFLNFFYYIVYSNFLVSHRSFALSTSLSVSKTNAKKKSKFTLELDCKLEVCLCVFRLDLARCSAPHGRGLGGVQTSFPSPSWRGPHPHFWLYTRIQQCWEVPVKWSGT